MALPLYSKVLTADAGFVAIGDIQPGRKVINSMGDPQPVDAVIDSEEKLFHITYYDGVSVKCGESTLLDVSGFSEDLTSWEQVTPSQIKVRVEEKETLFAPCLEMAPDYWEGPLPPLPHPKIIGSALGITSCVEGFLHAPIDDAKNVNKYLSTLPSYALGVRGREWFTFVYSEDALKQDEFYQVIKDSNLLSGDSETFKIPSDYLKAPATMRAELLNAILWGVSTEQSEELTLGELFHKLPTDHPSFGEDLKYLIFSLGWTEDLHHPIIDKVVDTGYTETMRSLKLEGSDGLYVTKGFRLTR